MGPGVLICCMFNLMRFVSGAGESGKSTIVKQLKILHEDGYSQRECQQYIPVIFSNTVQSLAAILKALGPLGLSYEDPSKEGDAERFYEVIGDGLTVSFTGELIAIMKGLWEDDGVQQCFKKAIVYIVYILAVYNKTLLTLAGDGSDGHVYAYKPNENKRTWKNVDCKPSLPAIKNACCLQISQHELFLCGGDFGIMPNQAFQVGYLLTVEESNDDENGKTSFERKISNGKKK